VDWEKNGAEFKLSALLQLSHTSISEHSAMQCHHCVKVLLLLMFVSLSFPVRVQNEQSQIAILPVIHLFSWHCFLILSFLPQSLSQCGFLLSRTSGHGQVNILGENNVRIGTSSNRELA